MGVHSCPVWGKGAEMSKTHYLKTWPQFFEAVARGEKTFEIRRNDRNFLVGDDLILRKWDPKTELYVTSDGNSENAEKALVLRCKVMYMSSGIGLEPGYVLMSIVVQMGVLG